MLIETRQSPAILTFLQSAVPITLNMLGILKSDPDVRIFVDDLENPSGVVVCQNDYFHMIYTKNPAFIDAFCDTLTEGYYGFSGIDHDIAENIISRFKLDWRNPCTLYQLPKHKLDLTLQKHPAQPLTLDWVAKVDENYPYRSNHSVSAITANIKERPSSAIYIDGEPVSWVMIHEDYSMGIMHTMDEHRRHGYAIDVTIDLCRQLFELGEIPYLQIVETNQQSPGLALKCGFEPCGLVDWFGIIVGNPPEEE